MYVLRWLRAERTDRVHFIFHKGDEEFHTKMVGFWWYGRHEQCYIQCWEGWLPKPKWDESLPKCNQMMQPAGKGTAENCTHGACVQPKAPCTLAVKKSEP